MEILAFLRTLLRYLRPYWRKSLLLLLLLLVDVVFTTAWPLGFKAIIDQALPARDQALLATILAILLANVLIVSLASLGRDYLYAWLSSHVVHDVRLKLFTHLQRLSLAFYSRVGTGDILSRFSSDLTAVETAITWAMASLVLNTLTIVLGTILLFNLEWRLALLTVVGLIACLFAPRGLLRTAAAASYATKSKQAELAETVQENINAQSIVKAFSLERRSTGRFLQQSLQLAQTAQRSDFVAYVVERLPNVIILIFEILVIGAGTLLVFYGYRTLGTIVAFHAVFLNISASVGGLANVMPIILQSLGGLVRIEEVLNETPAIIDVPDAFTLPRLSGEMVFQDVRFAYGKDQTILSHANLTIRSGQFVAVVGPSGSGKSTILNLILRFYDPASGSVLFDAADIRKANQESLRNQIGVVFQENILFNISVRENVRLGNPAASDFEVEAAMRAAEIHDFVAGLPEGCDTVAGARGARFSGGQRQRLALARALIRNPSVLLLDEATSSLDPVTESAINATLARVARGRTVVFVTHRLSTISHADHILVLERGRVAEEGRHEALLSANGIYTQLWRKQAGFTLNSAGDEAAVAMERLRDVPILSQLGDSILSELPEQFVTERYPAGRRVIVQGDPGNKFYIIVRGKVDVVVEGPQEQDERIAVLHDGDYFGEIALLEDLPRSATVWTRAPSVFLTLERGEFATLLDRAPQLRASLVRTYLGRSDRTKVRTA